MILSKSQRLSLLRHFAIARGMIATLPGMTHSSHSEVAEEFSSLTVNHSAPAVLMASTSDDSSDAAPDMEHSEGWSPLMRFAPDNGSNGADGEQENS